MGPEGLRVDLGGGPWTLGLLARAAGGELLAGEPGAPLRGVALDTRAVRPGDLFCAVRGERVDAHALVPEALARGAAAVLVDRLPGDRWGLSAVPAGRGAIWVPRVASALGRLARWHLGRLAAAGRGPRVAAVTGSVGKTGTRALMAAALGAAGDPVLEVPESFNTELTVPLVCLGAGPQHRFAALELAMRGPGQIAHLADVARPEVGALTVIGESHLEVLGSVEAIVAAKGELVEALPPGGVAVLNADDPRQQALAARAPCRVVWYGRAPWAEVRAEGVAVGPEGVRFRAVLRGRSVPVDLPLLGAHQVGNALVALAVADAFGVAPEVAAEALARVRPVRSRLELRTYGRIRVLDDAYNAAPRSTVAALEALAAVAPDPARRAAVLGDMLELGPAAPEGHAEVGRAAARLGLAWLVAVGPLARGIGEAAVAAGLAPERVRWVPDREAACAWLPRWLEDGLTVLVKGSRAVGLEAVVAAVEAWARDGARPPRP